jgi:WD40 repeat protein
MKLNYVKLFNIMGRTIANKASLFLFVSAEQYRTSSDYSRAVISPGDSFVAAGSADGHIFVWNLHTTRLEKVLFKGGHEWVFFCEFNFKKF